MEDIFYNSIKSIYRILILGFFSYVGLIILLRISRKRTLSKMNAFDFVVTVALGSTLATIFLNKNVSLIDGLVAFALLIFLQYSITWISVRSSWFEKLVKSKPTLMFYKGEFMNSAMKKERITKNEIISTIRQHGFSNTKDVDAVVLESDGSFSVMSSVKDIEGSVIEGVKRINT